MSDNADAALRNSRAHCLHHIMRRPGRGGLTAKGAEQLRQYFSKKVPDTEKLSLREMDESAVMIVLQMAAEEVDTEGLSYGELRRVAEKELVANRAEDMKGGDGENENLEEHVVTEMFMEAKESPNLQAEQILRDENLVGGSVALGSVSKLCIRSKKQGDACQTHEL